MRTHKSYVDMGKLGAKSKWEKEPPFQERFWSRVNVLASNDCWLWIKSVNKKTGYAKTSLNGKKMLSHRAAYFIKNGEIPKGKCVCHSCDNRRCCNPNHLWVGTHKENMQDASRKGRLPHPKTPLKGWAGVVSPMAKLTPKKVINIRQMHKTGKFTQTEIGIKFGVGQDQISKIAHRKAWTWV